MVVRSRLLQVLAAVAVVVAASGCGGGDEGPSVPTRVPLPSGTSSPTSVPSPGNLPPDNPPPGNPPPGNPPPGNPPPGNPPPGNPPQASGTVVIQTRTLAGTPVPNVPVNIRLVQPCDPATHDIPLGSNTEVLRRDAVTDASGSALFVVPVGCYRFGLGTPPPGTTPVPEGMHSLFLVRQGDVVSGELRFQNPAPPAPCSAQAIVADLDDIGALGSDNATVSACDGKWAVIVWNVPGDSQRIVRKAADGWTTYVVFPHDVCWSKATADGVPANLKKYFTC